MPRRRKHSARLAKLAAAAVIFLAGLVAEDIYAWIKSRVLPAPPALRITVVTDPKFWEAGRYKPHEPFEYVFPAAASKLAPPPSGTCYRRYAWAKQHGGVDAQRTQLRLFLQSPEEHAVLLESITPVIRRRSTPMAGTFVACPVGGATANLRHVAVDLDRGEATYQDGEGAPVADRMLTFRQGETEALAIVAWTGRYRVSWQLRLDLVIDTSAHRAVGRRPSTQPGDGLG
jgi:hypothetical protein